jgi:hypothetical protein
MSELTSRIRRVTEDLRAIQDELGSAAMSTPGSAERERVMAEMMDLELVHELKSAVDHMRHLLWSYIEAASQSDRGENVSQTLRTVRMQRVTEMLKILQPSVRESEIASEPEAESFFEVIQSIANSALERHHNK